MMSPSAKTVFTLAAVFTVAIITAAWLLRPEEPASRNRPMHQEAEITTADVRTARLSTREQNKMRQPVSTSESKPAEPLTSGVKLLSSAPTPPDLPPLTGYVVDSFENWTTIPAGYNSDGLVLSNGAITLAGISETTEPRFGQMVSPPLPLTAPALAAPVGNPRQLPDDASLTLEISLSEDGTNWSPWIALEKYARPDGKRVTPPLQASISHHELATHNSAVTSSSPSGPSVRYRLTLSASASASPAVADIRIWKRELQ